MWHDMWDDAKPAFGQNCLVRRDGYTGIWEDKWVTGKPKRRGDPPGRGRFKNTEVTQWMEDTRR